MVKSETSKIILDTPCIGVCSTVYGDTVCRGCKREFKEVIEWNGYDQEKRQGVYQRLAKYMSKVVSRYIIIIHPEQLQEQLTKFHIRSRPFDDAFCSVHHLLRIKGSHIEKPEEYGFEIKAEFQHLSISALFTIIDETLHEFSIQTQNT